VLGKGPPIFSYPRTKFSPQGFTTRSNVNTANSRNAKSVWSFRASTCAERMTQALATLKTLSALCLTPAGSALFLPWRLSTTCSATHDHVDISQAFVQGDLLPGDGHNGKVYISPPPGYTEDDGYVCQLRRPLYGMPSVARAWHTTMSAYLKSQGCALVGFERSMWCATINGHTLLIEAHIYDFILACADRDTLDTFRTDLGKPFAIYWSK